MQAVFFDLFDTLISEFDHQAPSSLDVANRVGIDVDSFVREYSNLRPQRYSGQLVGYERILQIIVHRHQASVDEAAITAMVEAMN